MVMAGYRAAFGQLPDNGRLNYWAGTIRTGQCQGQAQTTGAANHIGYFVNGPEWGGKLQALHNAGCLPG